MPRTKEYVVCNPDLTIRESPKKVVLHVSEGEALKYGQDNYKRGFVVKPYSYWRNTQTGKYILKCIEIKTRLNKWRKQ